MKLHPLIVAVGLTLAASPVFAFQCPKDMKAIDAALPNAKLSAEQMAEVRKLRADGETAHKAGKHQESADLLAKAMKLVGV